MSNLDKDYENAIRCYLDELLLPQNATLASARTTETNVAKIFSKHIKGYSGDKNFTFSTPMYAWWDLTSACNFRCVHCLYNDSDYSSKNDLSQEEAIMVADGLINDLGITEVILSGGEIFLRKDLIDIVKLFKQNNVAVKLLTNASLITDEQIEILADIFSPYCDSLQISLDGATNETYKSIRLCDDFDKVVNNIKKIVDKNLVVAIAGTVNKLNYNEIPMLYEFCNSLNVDMFFASKMMYYNDSHKKLDVTKRELILLAEKLMKMEEKLSTKLKLGFFSNFEIVNNPDVLRILTEKKYQNAISNRTTPLARGCNLHDRIAIKPNGNVYMCSYASCIKNVSMGNVRENSLAEIWQNRGKNVLYAHRDENLMNCKKCKYNVFCTGGCMAKAYKNFGNINMPETDCVFYK